MEVKKDLGKVQDEQTIGQEVEWKKMSPEETVELFQRVIPIGSEIFKQKALFIDGKIYKNESKKVLFFVSKIGKKGDSVVFNWKEDLFDKEGRELELAGDLNVACQKIPGQSDSILLSSGGTTEKGQKWEMIRKFQSVR